MVLIALSLSLLLINIPNRIIIVPMLIHSFLIQYHFIVVNESMNRSSRINYSFWMKFIWREFQSCSWLDFARQAIAQNNHSWSCNRLAFSRENPKKGSLKKHHKSQAGSSSRTNNIGLLYNTVYKYINTVFISSYNILLL